MKTILVDDELWSMEQFERECGNSSRFEIVGKFSLPGDALAYAAANRVDFALLDIEMPEMDGLTLGWELRRLRPDVIIIYVTAHSKYALDAIKQKADFVVLKPYAIEDVEDALERALLLSARQRKPIFIRTFGSFDVFVDGNPVSFPSAKAKELLALLVDRRGGLVSSDEVLSCLWEDRVNNDAAMTACRKAAAQLRKILAANNASELLLEHKRGRSVDVTRFDCDYYDYLAGIHSPQNCFNGEYMLQYSWAEVTAALLSANRETEPGQ